MKNLEATINLPSCKFNILEEEKNFYILKQLIFNLTWNVATDTKNFEVTDYICYYFYTDFKIDGLYLYKIIKSMEKL